jgi:hypothetical protein
MNWPWNMVPEQELLAFPPEAVWIGSDHPFDLHEVYIRFRSPTNWQLVHFPKKAELFITADSRYKLWMNGQFVARGPARCFPESQAVDRLDVTAYMRVQENVLAAEVYQPGYSHFAYVHRGAAGLLAYLVCDGQVVLFTDTSWRTSRDRSYSSLVPRVSIYGSGVEERTLRQAEKWLDFDFADDDWPAARLVAPVGGSPWTSLRPRQLPLLEERDLPAKLLDCRRGSGTDTSRLPAHQAVREGWVTAKKTTIVPDETGAFHCHLAANEAAYLLFDLGRDLTCQGWAEIEGASGREQLSLSYLEKMSQGQLVLPDPRTYCRLQLTDRFQLRSGSQTAESFSLRGGRYLLWQLVGPTGADFRFRPQVRVAEYPLMINRPITTSDKLLAQIIHLCETTIRACLQDGFVDCIWRESSLWLGDALPQSLGLWAMSGDVRPIRQVIVMAAQGAYPDGILPSVMPGEVHAYTIVRYNFMWVELLHFYQQITGDNALVSELWSVLQKMLETVYQYRLDGDLLVNPPGRRLYIDWSPTSLEEPHAVYNLHFVLALQRAGQLARAQDLEDDAQRWQQRASKLQAVIRQAFYTNGRWYDDLQRTTYSQLAAALACLTNTIYPREKDSVLDDIAARSLDASDDYLPDSMVLASPFMHHYILEALRQAGRFEQMLEIIRLRWGRWVKQGYPTTWENWSVDFPDGSLCHSFSAHPRFHLAEIARQRGKLP